jgi:serine/threonine protein kinase
MELSSQTNILIDNAGNAVLADFGHSRILGASGFTTSTITIAGTFRYMAPELMVPENPDITPTPTIASDVWAAGMTGLEVRLQIIVAHAPDFDFDA